MDNKEEVKKPEFELREIKSLTDDYIVDDETYFSDQKYVTNSMLKTLINGSTYDLTNYVNAEQKETESLLVGSAFHCLLLEPDKFESRYVYAPKFDKRTKAGKEAYAEYEKTIGDRKPIPENYQEVFENLLERIKSNESASGLINNAKEREKIYFWKDVKTGLLCKGKVDAIADNYIVDIKTTSKGVDVNSFREFALKWHLANQAAFYCNGTQKKSFFFIMCQLKAPYNIAVYQMGDDALRYGNHWSEMTMNLYKEWKESGETLQQHINAGQIVVV